MCRQRGRCIQGGCNGFSRSWGERAVAHVPRLGQEAGVEAASGVRVRVKVETVVGDSVGFL